MEVSNHWHAAPCYVGTSSIPAVPSRMPTLFLTSSNTAIPLPALHPSTILQSEINWVIGIALACTSYGILITLGLTCIALLRSLGPWERGFWNQRTILMIHVSLLMLLNTAWLAKSLRANIIAIFKTDPEKLTYFYTDWLNILAVFILGLTDGLLVWRCYMVQRVLGARRTEKWHDICWIVPLIFWLILVGAGVVAVLTSKPNRPLTAPVDTLSLICLLISTFCNILLNLFATLNIIIRLLIHRRSMLSSFGRTRSLSRIHLRVVGILLESAAINLPIAISVAVCSVLVGGFGPMAMTIGIPSQSFSSALVIYQVARGRAVGSDPMFDSKGSLESQHLDTAILTTQG